MSANVLILDRQGTHFVAESRQSILEKAQSRFLETQKTPADRNRPAAEYQSEAKARALRTARLRDLRLAKDEAERIAEALKPVEPKKKQASRR